MATKKDYVVGSGNVFADLGYARPEEAAAKAELAHKIAEIIERRKLTQAEAATLLEVDQPKVSALERGRLSGFSLDRLVRFPCAARKRCRDRREESAAHSPPREATCRVGDSAIRIDGARRPCLCACMSSTRISRHVNAPRAVIYPHRRGQPAMCGPNP